ncbi:MAG TPA: hypothetical protein VI957_02810 [Candidatus Paceibacterota bacterium]
MTDQTATALASALGEGFGKGLIAGISGTVVITIFFGFLWIRYPNNVKLVFAQIWSLLTIVFGSVAERHYIVNHLEAKVGKGIEKLNQKVDGLDAEQIRITLVRDGTRDAFIRDRVLIMRLQKKDNHGENMANVAFLYSQHLYSKVDPSLNQTQQEAVRLYTAKSILKSVGQEGLQELSENFYRPVITKNTYIQALLNQLETIDSKGLFFSVFIQEMVFLGNKVLFRQRAKGVHEEVTKFTQFLVKFANRARGDEAGELDFRSQNIKVSFILAALKEKREADATQDYITRVKSLLPRDTESYYFMGWGDNIGFVRKVAEAVCTELSHLELKREKGYERAFEDGRVIDAMCILIRNRKIANLVESQKTQPQAEVARIPGGKSLPTKAFGPRKARPSSQIQSPIS